MGGDISKKKRNHTQRNTMIEQRENPKFGVSQSILAKNQKRTAQGKRGFIPVMNPKIKAIRAKVTPETKTFVEGLCRDYGINQTELILRALEYYTGFTGDKALNR